MSKLRGHEIASIQGGVLPMVIILLNEFSFVVNFAMVSVWVFQKLLKIVLPRLLGVF